MTEELDERSSILSFLDSKNLGIAILFIVVMLLSLFSIKLWSDLNSTVERLDKVVTERNDTVMKLNRLVEERTKEARASDEAAVARCYSSATQGPALRRVLLALELEAQLTQAKEDLREFRRLSELNTPTIRECRQLADELNVTPLKGATG